MPRRERLYHRPTRPSVYDGKRGLSESEKGWLIVAGVVVIATGLTIHQLFIALTLVAVVALISSKVAGSHQHFTYDIEKTAEDLKDDACKEIHFERRRLEAPDRMPKIENAPYWLTSAPWIYVEHEHVWDTLDKVLRGRAPSGATAERTISIRFQNELWQLNDRCIEWAIDEAKAQIQIAISELRQELVLGSDQPSTIPPPPSPIAPRPSLRTMRSASRGGDPAMMAEPFDQDTAKPTPGQQQRRSA